ncbi:acetyltransferase, GNAT family [Aspergillus sclerotioniger CBS 115572]|uniref:Acetyltransferase, GNAT family n=1 Tax=Aspergillus sclerotioniger CBS 115572 TaxID=1450535 RepID=A0A317V594_9EURO|nr:acetyltransferase, GNAT family [Aspergillus sclerotioniger CBS 115572]PWY68022.1 acetyltransferase, GNAT family [Aspergillus sclerotioniger CBS 115572]
MAFPRERGALVSLTPALLPSHPTVLSGHFVRLERLESKHAADLFSLVGGTEPARTWLWDFLPDEPYDQLEAFEKILATRSTSTDPIFFAIIDRRSTAPTLEKAIGYVSLLRITPAHWTVEIGHVLFSSALQRTPGATEAIYLLARHALEDLNYRRVEWKCDSLNLPSRKAAERLGFTFEGTFRQHMVVKGRTRDTCWFSMLQSEWQEWVKDATEQWLDAGNFDEDGKQKKRLQDFRPASKQ